MKLAYYPGCVSQSTGKEMDASTRAVCTALGIEIEELADWNCCGATHVSNELVATGLAARNMAQTDLPIMTACSICYSNLRAAEEHLKEPEVFARVNAVLDKKYRGAEVRHALDVMLEAMPEGDERIVLPLKGLLVAPYYGCLLTRPVGQYSAEFPVILETLIKRLEAEPVDFRKKTACCGGPIFMPQEKAADDIAFGILSEAKRAGAEVIVTVCPLCHLMLDAKQKILEQKKGEKIGIPVLYVTQLVGIALGLGPEELGLFMNTVSPMGIVEKAYERMGNES
jgi:heterodisulfide reductase subunit B2